MNFSALFPCFLDHLFFFLTFVSCHARIFSSFSHYFSAAVFASGFFVASHRNEFVNKTVISHRIHPSFSDMILMRFVSSSMDPWSRAFVGINNTSIFCLAFPNIAVGFHHCSLSVFCKALLLASELPTFHERLWL